MTPAIRTPLTLLDRWAQTLAEAFSGQASSVVITASGDGFVDKDGNAVALPLEVRSGRTVRCELDAERVVFVDLPIPPGAEDHVDGIVSSKLPQVSPWKVSDVIYGHALRPRDEAGGLVTIAIIGKADVPSIPFRGKGVPVTYCVRTPAGDRIDFRQPAAGGRRERAGKVTAIKALLVLLLLLTVGPLIAGPVQSYFVNRDLSAINRAQGALRARLERQSSGEAAADDPSRQLSDALNRRPSRLAVVAALAHLLPDSVHLESLTIEGDVLGFTAIADDAAMVLRLLAESPVFRNAAFSGPTVREEDSNSVRLQISAEIASDADAAGALEQLLLAEVKG